MPNPVPATVRKVTFGTIVGWVLGVFFSISAFGLLFTNPLAGILTALMAVLLLPPGVRMIRERLHWDLSAGARVAIILVLLVGIGLSAGTTEPPTTSPTPSDEPRSSATPATSSRTPEEQQYIDAMAVVTDDMTGIAQDVSAVFESAETAEDVRVLLVYRDQVNAIIARMDTFYAPPKFKHFHGLMRSAYVDYRDGLTFAEQGVRTNNSDLVNKAIALIQRSTQKINEATAELETLL